MHNPAQITKEFYGLDAVPKPLSGEADLNFYLRANDKEFLLKISQEKLENIELQNAVLKHLQATPVNFKFPLLQSNLSGEYICHLPDHHFARLFSFVSGKLFAESPHSPELLASLGTQLAHLTQALYEFQDTHAKRYLKWDLKQALWIKDQLSVIEDNRELINYFLQRFEDKTAPVLPQLRHSIIHGDINDHNIVVQDSQVSGFIDFGDVVETATICELAIALTYAILNEADPLSAAAHIIKSYHAVFPLQKEEINILFDLICMRLCVSVINSALRKKDNPHDAYLTVSEKPAWELLKKFREIQPESAINLFHQACSEEELQIKRKKYIGKNVKLSYQQPLHIVRGKGQYLYDENGRQYLDCVNNVAHVGHCHPKVVAAGQKQMAILNTNTRYLDENLIQYAEKLLATLPPPLEVCYFVCTGSEANELALRMARAHTQRENILVMNHAYHGNTSLLINISPYKFNRAGGKGKPDFVSVLDINFTDIPAVNPNTAAFIAESLLSCGGQIVLPPDYLQKVYAMVRNAGGVCIADEVQVGLGRMGTDFWGFQTQHVIADIVTMGKPLGNGHPLAAVVTTREIAESFNNGMEYFNTFGGNPVSCAIGLAVLQVMEEEKLQEHALQTGNYLKQELNKLKDKHKSIKDVRGLGLFLGVELDKEIADTVVNQMKERGILLSADGPLQNVLKIKPPMVFNREDSDFLVGNLNEVL